MDKESTEARAEALLTAYRDTRARSVRDELVGLYLYVADIIARRFSGRGVDYDDLYQVASMALVKAVERFDMDKGVKFTTFAMPTMVGEVKNYFRDKSQMIRPPRAASDLGRRLDLVRAQLEQTYLRAPTASELADALDVPLDTVLETLEMRGATRVVPLETTVGEDDTPLEAFLGFDERGYADFERRDLIASVIKTLPEEERRVLSARFWERLSQREIAEKQGVSQMTISRIERRALASLKEALADARE